MATQNVSEEQLQSQFTYIDAVARLLGDKRPKAYTHTFGCQQNEADTERIRGMLSEMGYEMTDTPDEADFILFNTCAVREHAEDRAFGNVGALRHLKKERPGIVIAMCGCMAQQEKNVEKIKKSYPQVCREAAEVVDELLGEGHVVTDRELSLSGDNFAEFELYKPGAYAYLGTGNPDLPHTMITNHNGGFDVDENALVTGAGLYVGYTVARLG